MKHVYIAGSYSAPSPALVERNVWNAIDAGARVMDIGLWPYVPHLSHYMEARRPRPYEHWMALDFAWIRRCDAVLRIPGDSNGADREVELACSLGIPVFTTIDGLRAWAENA